MNSKTRVEINRLVPWIAFLIFFSVLNETVFNVSTPVIAGQFSLSPSGVSWMMTIFMVFFGVSSVIFGKLSDLFSPRRLIFIGMAIYLFGSILGFLGRASYPWVIAARAIQGIGGSAIPALIFSIIARYVDISGRGKIFGFIISVVSFGIGLGPVLGGFISKTLHWSVLFLIPLLILISIPFFNRELPDEPRREGQVDIPGAFLIAATVGGLVLYLNFGQWYYVAALATALILFLVRIRVVAEPFIKPSLFANRKFRNGVIVNFCIFSMVLGILFLVPLMLSQIHGLNTGQIGLIIFPGAISSVFFGPWAGRLADRKGNLFVLMIGLGLLVSSVLLMAFLVSSSSLVISASLLMTYIGFSFIQTGMINSVSQTLPEAEIGIGMGVFNLVGIISGAIGTAVVGKSLSEKWLNFSLLPSVTVPAGYAYSNLMLMFAAVILAGGVLYFLSYRQPKAAPLCYEGAEC